MTTKVMTQVSEGNGNLLVTMGGHDKFRIVKRASLSPVITKTVTTKEIVPGIYGEIEILKSANGLVEIRIDNHLWTASDLREAIATLNEIADALEEK